MDENSAIYANIQSPIGASPRKTLRKGRPSLGTPASQIGKSPLIRVRTTEGESCSKRLNDSFTCEPCSTGFESDSFASACSDSFPHAVNERVMIQSSASVRCENEATEAHRLASERLYFDRLQQLGRMPVALLNRCGKRMDAMLVSHHAVIVRASEFRDDAESDSVNCIGQPIVEGTVAMVKHRALALALPVDLIIQGDYGRRVLVGRVVNSLLEGNNKLQSLYSQAAVVLSALGSCSLYELETETSHGWTEVILDSASTKAVALEIHPGNVRQGLHKPGQFRLFNIFHQILSAKPNAQELGLSDDDPIGARFGLISSLGEKCLQDLSYDARSDFYGFTELCAAFDCMGFTKEEQKAVFKTCIGLLHWSSITEHAESIDCAERLLGIPKSDLISLGGDATIIAAVYEDLFAWVIRKINQRFERELETTEEVLSPVTFRVIELSSHEDAVTSRVVQSTPTFSALDSVQGMLSAAFDSSVSLEGRLVRAIARSTNEQFIFHSVEKPIVANVQPGEAFLEYDSKLVTRLFPSAATMFAQDKPRVRVAESDWTALECDALEQEATASTGDISLLLARAVHCAEIMSKMDRDTTTVMALVHDLQCKQASSELLAGDARSLEFALNTWAKGTKGEWKLKSFNQLTQHLLNRLESAARQVESDVFKQVQAFAEAHEAFLHSNSDKLSEQLRQAAAIARRGEQGIEEAAIRAKIRSEDAMTRRAALASAVRLYPLPTVGSTLGSTKPKEPARGSLMSRLTRTPAAKRVQSMFRRDETTLVTKELDSLLALFHDKASQTTELWFKRGLKALIQRWKEEGKLIDHPTRLNAFHAAMDAVQMSSLVEHDGIENMNASLRLTLLSTFFLAFDLCDPNSKDPAGIQLAHNARAWVLQTSVLKAYPAVRERLEKLATGDDELYAFSDEALEPRIDALIECFRGFLGAKRQRVAEVRLVKNVEEAMAEATGESLFRPPESESHESSAAACDIPGLPFEDEDTDVGLPAPPKAPLSPRRRAIQKRREEWKATHVNCTALFDYSDPDGDELYLTVYKGEILWIPTKNQTGAALSKGKDWVMVERYCDDPDNPPKGDDGKPIPTRGYVPFSYVGFPGYQ